MFEIFLEMHECACCLDEPFEKIIVVGVGADPEMLQDIVRFIITLVVPAPKIRAIERMICDFAGKSRLRGASYGTQVGIIAFEVADKLRNPFAFVHEVLNFTMPQMMGKPTFLEGTETVRCYKKG